MKNLEAAKRIAERARLTNVRYLTLLEPDDDAPVAIHEDAAPGSILDEAVVIAVVGTEKDKKCRVFHLGKNRVALR